MTATTSPASTRIVAKKRAGDLWFSGTAVAAGSMIMITLAAVAIFLIVQSVPAFTATAEDASLLKTNFWDYVGPLLFGTVWAAFLALLLAVPLSLGVALFITHYAPRRLAQGLGYVVDLLAAVPSVVFGLWGILVLAPAVQPIYVWLNTNAGWIPFFGGVVSPTGRTILTAAMVLAVMVVPIITAICREIFLQTPRLHEEAALALGATRWEMVRMAVLPFGRSGIVSASMLGLGRALGETMAVAMVLSVSKAVTFELLTSTNPSTIAANIALTFPEAYQVNINILIATGLILFVVTFVVNALARWFVNRRKEFSGAN
ncbi:MULTISPECIES: phosphate ABC transporter permease subunit PstC [unclassified Microbacterium]|jgi:phosphate transport system permease protein|uniref:phosphate ABC transporter permease subunit PstC n=1 Tax=unclassified Microbacterium TaxID=2609290 RepID=UPI000422D243|nr:MULTISPECIES: phosphate ABC transporter permease subunit PstC [unclassified Microbacterium]PQZ52844.1 phosphate ABC transporter permease subunit PstC [Microbacterium sp. MYb43]PQZ74629.1 phosphate ABC transporter permease subunit PstC [Microbacterium sp. MYb40]PRB19474.1 phosphate ABC transporter permease subunit PstC [Microbacterium sp. MYb54]PRB24820.1 phosphate ABC transporter permease subunit PstC [Microbacterium sp. MYb50]PRB62983.1 phosphate ABC transporter permease subunit PstC [Micr